MKMALVVTALTLCALASLAYWAYRVLREKVGL